jgi:hypothetical protein
MNSNVQQTALENTIKIHELFDINPAYKCFIKLRLSALVRTINNPPDTTLSSIKVRNNLVNINRLRGMDFIHRGLIIAVQRHNLDRQEYDNTLKYMITHLFNMPTDIINIILQFLN